jgi:hypothetical protein
MPQTRVVNVFPCNITVMQCSRRNKNSPATMTLQRALGRE